MGEGDIRPLKEGNIMRNTEQLLEQMISHQQDKVLALARDILPYITPEDLLNPQHFPKLEKSSQFNFEDGLLAGLKSALIAIKQRG